MYNHHISTRDKMKLSGKFMRNKNKKVEKEIGSSYFCIHWEGNEQQWYSSNVKTRIEKEN